jgi:Sec-independent protein translocase protein TatA
VGFGTEILFMLMLGLVVLGPRRLHAMMGQVARAKAEFENAARGMKSQLAAELDTAHQDAGNDIVSGSQASNRVAAPQSPSLPGR